MRMGREGSAFTTPRYAVKVSPMWMVPKVSGRVAAGPSMEFGPSEPALGWVSDGACSLITLRVGAAVGRAGARAGGGDRGPAAAAIGAGAGGCCWYCCWWW